MLQDGALGVVTSLPDQTSGTNSSNSSLPVATRFHRVSLWRQDFIVSLCGDEISSCLLW